MVDSNEAAARPRWLLGIGATAGLALATFAVVEPTRDRGALPEDAAALVNGAIVRSSSYRRALSALARDSRNAVDDADRRHVLDRLIEEELLVQRATELGLDQTDPAVRNSLVSAMIEIIVSGVGQEEPSALEVEQFYAENREFFAHTDRFWVRQLRFAVKRGDDENEDRKARAKAGEAAPRLRAGEALSRVGRDLEASGVLPLPDGYLPVTKLREYLGPTPAAAAAAMQTGEVSDPVRGGSAWHVLQMVERITNPPLPLEAVESQVRAEMRRRAGDESLRAYLDQLRANAEVRLPTS